MFDAAAANEIVIPNIDRVQTREPLITPVFEKQNIQRIERFWGFLSEFIRRELLVNVKLRDELRKLIDVPVSEKLFEQFLHIVAENQEIGALIEKYGHSAVEYSNISEVPKDKIYPDVSNTPTWNHPLRVIARYISLYGQSELGLRFRDKRIQEVAQNVADGSYMSGLSAEEKNMIVRRHVIARDIKLLVLESVLIDEPVSIHVLEETDNKVVDGISIRWDSKSANEVKKLLQIDQWRGRKKIKDRVYTVSIGDYEYILKEKKTKIHTDTVKGGHRDGNTSEREFEMALLLSSHESMRRDDAEVTWEKPYATVTFPDGFSFVLFEKQHDLLGYAEVKEKMTEEITKRVDYYRSEYLHCVAELKKRRAFWERVHLTFDEWVKIKVESLIHLTSELSDEILFERRVTNRDHDGYAYRMRVEKNRVLLQMFCFDAEYVQPVTESEAQESFHFSRANLRHMIHRGIEGYKRSEKDKYETYKIFYQKYGMDTYDEEILRQHKMI